MALFPPLRRRVWNSTVLPTTPAQQWKPNWANPLFGGNLAFLFLPTPIGFFDVVRGDVMTLSGTTPSVNTPFGRSWVMGSTAGSVGGYASTAGGNKYYDQSPTNMTIMCGAYNTATIVNATNALFARWSDSSSGSAGNCIFTQCADVSGTPRMAANVDVASSNGFAIASGGAGVTMATSGQGMTYCGTYNGATIGAYYSSTALGFGSATSAKTGTPAGIDRVILGDTSSSQTANRCILWALGIFGVPTLAQITAAVATNGGLPAGLLRRK